GPSSSSINASARLVTSLPVQLQTAAENHGQWSSATPPGAVAQGSSPARACWNVSNPRANPVPTLRNVLEITAAVRYPRRGNRSASVSSVRWYTCESKLTPRRYAGSPVTADRCAGNVHGEAVYARVNAVLSPRSRASVGRRSSTRPSAPKTAAERRVSRKIPRTFGPG